MLRVLAAAVLCAVLGACGPVSYVREVTRGAAGELAAARAAGAPSRSPYWYTRAALYLAKAHEEAARADFQTAARLGRVARAAAARARVEALRGDGGRPAPRPAARETR